MPYWTYYSAVDTLIPHFDAAVASSPGALVGTYTGFLAVSAITAYELAIKDVFIQFAEKKHKVLANFTREFFDRINGRIKISVIKSDYLSKYGQKYLDRFEKKLAACEEWYALNHLGSVISSYGNLITWRNEFAHEGRVPTNATYPEAKKAYMLGKEVIQCLAFSMKR